MLSKPQVPWFFLLHMHHQRCYKVLALATIFENITQVKLIISNSVLFEFDRKRNKKKQYKLENYPIRNEMVFLKKKITIKISIKSNNWDRNKLPGNKLEKISVA